MTDTTVSVLDSDGEAVVTVPLDEISDSPEFADALARGVGLGEGHLAVQHGDDQLTFEIAGDAVEEFVAPHVSTFGVGGTLASRRRQLQPEEKVLVTISTPEGEVLTRATAEVKTVAFIKHDATPTSGAFIERAHKLKVTGSA